MTSGSGKIWRSYARYPTYTKSYYRRWRRYWRTAGKRAYTRLMPNNYSTEMIRVDLQVKNDPQYAAKYGYGVTTVDSSIANQAGIRIPQGRTYTSQIPLSSLIQTHTGCINLIRKYAKFRIKSYALEGKIKTSSTHMEEINICLCTSVDFNNNISAFELLQNPANMQFNIHDDTKRYFRKFPFWNEWINATNVPDFMTNTAFVFRGTKALDTIGVVEGNFTLTIYIEGGNKSYNQGVS